MLLSEAMPKFLAWMEINNNPSPMTLKNYNQWFKKFYNWSKDIHVENIDLKLIDDFRYYLHFLKKPNGDPSLGTLSKNHHIIALRCFLNWCLSQDIKTLSPSLIRLAKVKQKEASFLTRNEFIKLFDTIKGNGIRAIRNKAIVWLLFSTGLRVSEFVSLNRDDISLEERQFSIMGKGSKQRVVFLSVQAVEYLRKYLEKRIDNFPALFINYKAYRKNLENPEKRRFGRAACQRMIKSLAKKAGFDKKITPHALRHSLATELLINGADIRSVQEVLGHTSISSTMIYTHITNPRLKEIHAKFFCV